jgi:hypothetical protein
MAEVFAELGRIVSGDGRVFVPRVFGAPFDHMWAGWIEFTPVDGGDTIRTARETTQPNRTDLAYWATGLTATYLDGALARALAPPAAPREMVPLQSAYDEPAPRIVSPVAAAPTERTNSVLDPFAVYENGEVMLRRQLAALAPWHLAAIIRDYDLSRAEPSLLEDAPQQVLIDVIVNGVKGVGNRVIG